MAANVEGWTAMTTLAIPSMPGVEVGRESTRRIIAYIAIGGFLLVLTGILIGGWFIMRAGVDDVLKVLTTTASVLGGIVGAIVGFYFQTKE